jgi:hypothetical protein
VTLAELRIDGIILSCAVSAGIHAALVPDHFEEGTTVGIGFVAAAALPALIAVILTRRPSQLALVASILVFTGLIAAYALVLTTGLPVLHPEVEAVDALALFTKGVEVLGLMMTASLIRRPSPRTLLQPKGRLT